MKRGPGFITTINLAAYAGGGVELLRQTRAGEVFIDKNGREVEVSPADLEAAVANFEAGTAGQDIPIDIDHERGQSAGWFTRMWTEARAFAFPDPENAGEKITVQLEVLKALPEWNKLGVELVGEKIYKYFSVWFDLTSKTIKSASLVNFPAVKGLEPAELAEGASFAYIENGPMAVSIRAYLSARIHYHFTRIADEWAAAGMVSTEERIEMSGAIGAALTAFGDEIGEVGERMIQSSGPDLYFYSGNREGAEALSTVKEVRAMKTEEEVREEVRQEMGAELAARQTREAELREEVRQEMEVELAARQVVEREVAGLAETLCNGEGAALSSDAGQVAGTLMKIDDPELRAEIADLLRAKVVDFGEAGSTRDGQAELKALEEPYRHLLGRWVEDGHPIGEFFEVNREETGEMEQYDLAAFQDK